MRPKLSYANVVSTLCLFLLLAGGAAFAAIHLPKNSVGTKQLKKNAVNSIKVKNRSLQAVDFKAGQLPAGPQGPKGDPGPAGAPATRLWADVSDQELPLILHGEGVTSVEKSIPGVVIVTFDRNVNSCSYQVTPTHRSPGYWSPDSTATVTIDAETGGPNQVAVATAQNETLGWLDFSIAVFC